MSSWDREPLASPGELALASRVSGVLWLSGAILTLLLTLALPGAPFDSAVGRRCDRRVCGGVGRADALAGPPGPRGPVRLSHLSTVLSLGIVAALVAATGSTDSPALDYLWFIVVYSAFFYPPRQALAYWLACGVVHALPFLYDGHATDDNLARQLVVAVPIYCLVGGVVVAARAPGRRPAPRERARGPTAPDGRGAGLAAARGHGGRRRLPADRDLRARFLEAGHLLGADGAAIVRYEEGERVTVLGRWSHDEQGPIETATPQELLPDCLLERLRSGEAIAREEVEGEPRRVRLAAPVHTGTALWGALVVAAPDTSGFAPGAQERLPDYTDLIATAVANAEDARGWTPRRRSTGSPGCPTIAPSASA